MKFPLPAIAAIPRHVTASRIEAVAPAALAQAFSQLRPELISAVPDGSSETDGAASRWTIVAEATDADVRTARSVVSGPDTYGTTAVIAVESARQL